MQANQEDNYISETKREEIFKQKVEDLKGLLKTATTTISDLDKATKNQIINGEITIIKEGVLKEQVETFKFDYSEWRDTFDIPKIYNFMIDNEWLTTNTPGLLYHDTCYPITEKETQEIYCTQPGVPREDDRHRPYAIQRVDNNHFEACVSNSPEDDQLPTTDRIKEIQEIIKNNEFEVVQKNIYQKLQKDMVNGYNQKQALRREIKASIQSIEAKNVVADKNIMKEIHDDLNNWGDSKSLEELNSIIKVINNSTDNDARNVAIVKLKGKINEYNNKRKIKR